MSHIRRFIGAVDTVNRWMARKTGLYLIDVWLWNRKAVQLEHLAAEVEAATPAGAVKLRRQAERFRLAAIERAL